MPQISPALPLWADVRVHPPPPTFCPSHRFADSIRGMLKLILVLMLAGASLASTWLTLTCLSRATHLPSTPGGCTAASLSGVTLTCAAERDGAEMFLLAL